MSRTAVAQAVSLNLFSSFAEEGANYVFHRQSLSILAYRRI